MEEGTGRKKRAWFWVGVVLLSLSALFWLLLIPAMLKNPNLGAIILFIFLTALPIGIGIYGIRRGRKAPVAKIQKAGRATYATQHIVKPAHPRMTEQKKEVLIIIIGLVVLFGVIAGFGLYHWSQFTENEPFPGDWKFDVGDEIVFTGGVWKEHHAVVLDKDDYHSWPGGQGMASSGRAYLLKFDNGAEKWLREFLADGYAKKLKPD